MGGGGRYKGEGGCRKGEGRGLPRGDRGDPRCHGDKGEILDTGREVCYDGGMMEGSRRQWERKGVTAAERQKL